MSRINVWDHLLFAVAVLGVSLATIAGREAHAEALNLTMETHAAFFSNETKQAKPIDPQVFVRDSGAGEATGPQNIKHDAGFRPALLSDPAPSELFNAHGEPLGFSLGEWLGAKGTVTISADGKTVSVRLEHLRPRGTYSLFENHFDQQPIGFTPLDGTGSRNSFVADATGNATITVTAPERLTHANAVLLVYHSDNASHGMSRGEIGVNAHHQLIARLP